MSNDFSERELTTDEIIAQLKKIQLKPVLNKLFNDESKPTFDPRFQAENMSTSKDMFSAKYNVPYDSKIYNFNYAELLKITQLFLANFSQKYKTQFSKEVDKWGNILKFYQVTAIGVCFSFAMRSMFKWTRLTSGPLSRHIFLGFGIILSGSSEVDQYAYYMCINSILKNSQEYDSMISKFQGYF